jgi:hypothetical protein
MDTVLQFIASDTLRNILLFCIFIVSYQTVDHIVRAINDKNVHKDTNHILIQIHKDISMLDKKTKWQ